MQPRFYRNEDPGPPQRHPDALQRVKPLVLDEALEAIPRTRHQSIFRLPSETLHQIVEYLEGDSASLSSLALVNTDFCQLVRALRFAELTLQGDARSIEITFRLAQEVIQRFNGTTRQTIGACIRKLNLRERKYSPPSGGRKCWYSLEERRAQLAKTISAVPIKTLSLSKEQKEAWKICAEMDCITQGRGPMDAEPDLPAHERLAYLTTIITALRFAMPHLVAFELCPLVDLTGMRVDRLQTLSHCFYQVDHLKISIFRDQWAELNVNLQRLNLRSLDLELLGPSRFFYLNGGRLGEKIRTALETDSVQGQQDSDKIVTTILRACAGSLEKFVLRSPLSKSQLTRKEKLDGFDTFSETIKFPGLRMLELESLEQTRTNFFSLLTSGVRHLKIGSKDFDTFVGHWRTTNLRNLDSLAVRCPFSRSANEFTEFLNKHRHIKRLKILGFSEGAMDEVILPYLATGGFSSLTSLSLISQSTRIRDPETILPSSVAAIGLIETLEFLHLQRHKNWDDVISSQWNAEHNKMRQYLNGLRNLKFLAFTGDGPSNYLSNDVVDEDKVKDYFWLPDYNNSTPDVPEFVLNIEVLEEEMMGAAEDLVNMRARPELDDYLFDPKIVEEQGVADAETIAEGRARDRYCVLGMRDWFEIVLRNRLLDEVEQYAAAFPKLRLAYMGQLLMEIKVMGSGSKGNAVPLYRRRRAFEDIPSELFDLGDGRGEFARYRDWF